MSRLIFVLGLWLMQVTTAGEVFAQPGGGTGTTDPGGGGNPFLIVTITPLTPTDLPMGETVKLRADHDPIGNPTYAWGRQCYNLPQMMIAQWTTKEIEDCVGIPSEMTYTAYVQNSTISGEGSRLVKWHEPNEAVTTIGGLLPYDIPFPGSPSEVQQQIMQTTLKWNGQDLGPCATLCYRERVSVRVKQPYANNIHLRRLNFLHVNWIPANCTKTYYGWTANPTAPKMNWASPTLYDRNWFYWTFPMMKTIQ